MAYLLCGTLVPGPTAFLAGSLQYFIFTPHGNPTMESQLLGNQAMAVGGSVLIINNVA